MTRDAVARRAGLHPTTYSKAVSGANRPTDRTLKAFVRALERIEADKNAELARLAAIAQPERNAA